jgi:hypothetical protein
MWGAFSGNPGLSPWLFWTWSKAVWPLPLLVSQGCTTHGCFQASPSAACVGTTFPSGSGQGRQGGRHVLRRGVFITCCRARRWNSLVRPHERNRICLRGVHGLPLCHAFDHVARRCRWKCLVRAGTLSPETARFLFGTSPRRCFSEVLWGSLRSSAIAPTLPDSLQEREQGGAQALSARKSERRRRRLFLDVF